MDNRAIGVFDSGLGGLTAVKEIMNILPNESIIYFGDTGRVPYGTRSPETIVKYTFSDINFLLTFDIKAIVIACGTASSVALEPAKERYSVPIFSVVPPTAKAAALATKNGKIGIIGTSGTIKSGSYQKHIAKIDDEIKCYQMACPLFVPLVENGHTEDEIAYLSAKEYLTPLKNAGIDTLILGCTHYPLLKKVISEIMGENVKLINSGEESAKSLCEKLKEDNLLSNTPSENNFYVSDNAGDFDLLASRFLNKPVTSEPIKVEIEKY